MTPADSPKDGLSTSTPDLTEETIVEREVLAIETDDGYLIFQADDKVFDPPVCVSKEKFLALFARATAEAQRPVES